jgi:hypothetical protein
LHEADILASKKVQTKNVSTKKLNAKLLYKKFTHKIMVKLTTGVDFTQSSKAAHSVLVKSIGGGEKREETKSLSFFNSNLSLLFSIFFYTFFRAILA